MTTLPFPSGSDKMADTDVHIKELAESVQYGTGTTPSTAAGANADVALTFSPAFAAPPAVIAQPGVGSSSPQNYTWQVFNVTETGALLRIRNGGGGAVAMPYSWVAIGQVA